MSDGVIETEIMMEVHALLSHQSVHGRAGRAHTCICRCSVLAGSLSLPGAAFSHLLVRVKADVAFSDAAFTPLVQCCCP